MREKIKIWQPLVRRFGKRGALLLLGLPLALIIGGTGSYALFFGTTSDSVNSAVNLDKGLVGWWKMNGNAKDSTPYANNGTVNGATPTTDREGAANSAYGFNGSNNYISVPTTFPAGTSITAGAWVYLTSIPTVNGGIVSAVSASYYGTISMFPNANGGGTMQVGVTTNTGWQAHSSSGSLSTGQWYYLVAWANQSTQQYGLYINGVSSFTQSFTGSLEAATSFNIGLFSYQSVYFPGRIDDVRLYNRALSVAEVTALYQQYNSSVNADSGENGLVGQWRMDGNAKDNTPNADNGTVSGAALTTDRHGTANSAYSFNGSSNYIQVPDTATLNSTSALSISVWINPSTFSSTGYAGVGGSTIIGTNVNGGGDGWILGVASSTNKLWWWPAGSQDKYSAATIPTGQWTHVVLTFSSGTLKIYLNGVLDSSQSAATPQVPTSAFEVGAKSWITGWFAGSMDDLRMYNRALSANEVTNLYKSYNSQVNLYGASSTVNLSSGLVGWWPFSGNAKDNTPYGDNGTVNGATLTTDRHGAPNSAYSFNGSSSYINLGTPAELEGLQVPVTIAGWFYMTSTSPANKPIYAAYSAASGGDLWSMIRVDGGNLLYYTSNSSGAYQSFGSMSPSTNAWHFFAVTVSGTVASPSVTIYLDGSNQSTSLSSLDSSPSLTVPIYIGGDASVSGERFPGVIDEIHVYNRALSAAEVSALHNLY